MPNDESEVRLQVRLPRDLHADLTALAATQERSLNGQIVYTLRRGLDWYKGIPPTSVERAQIDRQAAPPASGPHPRQGRKQ